MQANKTLWLCLCAFLSACPGPEFPPLGYDAQWLFADAGRADGGTGRDVDLGEIELPDTAVAIVVDEIVPASGVVNGGFRVRVTGEGFNPETTVRFGENLGSNVLLQNSRSLTVQVPAAALSGPIDVVVDNGAYSATLSDGFVYFDALSVDSVTPTQAPVAGGVQVVVHGSGFVGELLVLCAGREAVGVEVRSEQELAFVVPPGPAGLADIEILSAYGRGVLPLGLRYIEKLVVSHVEPPTGLLQGDNAVIIYGNGFSSASRVRIGASAVLEPNHIDTNRLQVRVPAASVVGAVDVVVDDEEQSARLEAGYVYTTATTGSLQLKALSPAKGSIHGGQRVALVGDGFDQGVLTVRFGFVSATVVHVESASLAYVSSPAHSIGTVNVEVDTGAGTSMLAAAYRYEDSVHVETIVPTVGPAQGGTEVLISGSGFGAQSLVSLGGLALLDSVVVDAGTIRGRTPPGSSGLVDVCVKDALQEQCFVAAFRYVADLNVLGVRPARGGMGGDTYTSVYGHGFSGDTQPSVTFDGIAAGSVHVVSDNLITVYSPAHMPGAVDVEVRRSADSTLAARAFTYFDPTFLMGGTRGGPIDGAIYVSVFHGITGLPLAGITALLGTRPETPYVKVTDNLGQATLSGPDVHGPQTLSIGAAGYDAITLVEVNAAQVSLFLTPTVIQPSTGQPPPLPPPPVVSGRVFGFSKELFDPAALGPGDTPLAIVETTVRSVFSSAQAPQQSQYVVVEGGEYVIPAARPGRFSVVAVAGIFNLNDQSFRLRQLGFHRGVNVTYGDVVDGVDVELSVALDKELSVVLPDPPFGTPYPDTSVVLPFLNFGGEGVYPLPQHFEPGTARFDLVDFPDVPGELLSFVAGVFKGTTTGSLASPYSVVVRDGVGDLSSGISLGPLLDLPELIDPQPNGLMYGNRIRWRIGSGTQPSYYNIMLLGFDGIIWTFYVPGQQGKLVVPVFPQDFEDPAANLGVGAYVGYMSAVYAPGFDFNSFSYLDLSSQARRSWTQDEFRFANTNTP